MKIFIDSQIYLLQPRGGISRYFSILTAQLRLKEKITLQTGHKRRYVRNPLVRLILFTYCSLFDYLKYRQKNFDIYHQTYFWLPFRIIKNKRRVITVFDMNWEVMKSQSRFPYFKSKLKCIACKRADHIITISNSTRADLIKLFNISPEKVTTIHLGVGEDFFVAKLQKYARKKKQILFVGKRSGYKNFDIFMQAFAGSQCVRSQFSVLCVGGGGFTRAEKILFQEYGLSETEIQHRDLTDAELIEEYKCSRCLVYPSLYEGFGLPILEAGAAGCAVITSDSSSMKEIGEGSCILVDPHKYDELREALEMVCFNDALMWELIEKGWANAKRYTWMETSRRTLKLYEGLI